jgi:hypothetical protein
MLGKINAGLVAGEHIVRAALVSRFAMRHRADDGDLVGDLRRLRQRFAKHFARRLGGDRPHVATIFQRRVRLRIERLLMGDAAGQVDMNHTLGLGLEELIVLLFGAGFAEAEVVRPTPVSAPTVRNPRRLMGLRLGVGRKRMAKSP